MNQHGAKKAASRNHEPEAKKHTQGKDSMRIEVTERIMTPGATDAMIQVLKVVGEKQEANRLELKNACIAKDAALIEKWARKCTGLDD